jgi:hypothetical protein
MSKVFLGHPATCTCKMGMGDGQYLFFRWGACVWASVCSATFRGHAWGEAGGEAKRSD